MILIRVFLKKIDNTAAMKDFYSLSVPKIMDSLIKQEFTVSTFKKKFSFFYSDQIPNVAIFLISGEITLSRDLGEQKVLPGHIVGLSHLFNQWISSATATIGAGSTSVAIDRTQLLSQVQKNNELGKFFQKYLTIDQLDTKFN